ncbi:maleylpyruvate isomerase family mycothiol-dependent enzyme [Streptomyces alboniger]|uniref:Maleylpyruvate isomerase family mycothiol-dependent enzyme n=1 Tax=Streptomyces alboniger TaxID=132473 RepID=A0A5J6HJX1_STRAD|nr:maleylpyruvate isomerase family mycothiol-dependent enzyme [Streptomyces alboniger]QEV20526.1 maleylpyruvate isomerase family mycothiol-dependent enzyme [Streptomyces alboniger]
MTTLSHDRYCAEVTTQIDLLRATLRGADLSVTVPTCPDWTLSQLARHMGGAVRWSERLVATRAERNIPDEDVPDARGPESDDPAALDRWLADTAALGERTFRTAGADAPAWSWAGDHTAGFWARRMTHELAIHRADAAIAAGVAYEIAPDVAADAIDEWLDLVRLTQLTDPEDSASELKGGGRSLHLHATDAPPGLNAEWLIEFGEDGFTWRRGHAKATVALRGPLTEVLLAFYRRRSLDAGRVEVVGERELLDFWLERATFG